MIKSHLRKVFKFISNPVFVFVAIQIVWVACTTLWVVWFINQKNLLEKASAVITTDTTNVAVSTTILILGCLLLSIVLVGTVFFFVLYQRQDTLLKQQRNFVSSVTHEFRSPLSSLKLSFDTLLTKTLTDDVRQKFVRIVHSDIDRLSMLVEKILVSGKLDKGLFDYSRIKDRFTVKELIGDILEKYTPDTAERITLTLDQDIAIVGPKIAYEMIVGNVIENALKYSPPGSVIDIVAQRHLFNRLSIAVRDQGYGISRKEQKKVFQMFYRGDVSEQRAIKGTGLGLFIVKSTLQKLGGKVKVERNGQQGTTIKMTFRLENG